MDHVSGSNLNRCLFFEEEDAVSKRSKAAVLASKATALHPEARVEGMHAKIEEFSTERFAEHSLVFGCLDNVGARMHVNAHS